MNDSDEPTPGQKWQMLGMILVIKVYEFFAGIFIIIKGILGLGCALIFLAIVVILVLIMLDIPLPVFP